MEPVVYNAATLEGTNKKLICLGGWNLLFNGIVSLMGYAEQNVCTKTRTHPTLMSQGRPGSVSLSLYHPGAMNLVT